PARSPMGGSGAKAPLSSPPTSTACRAMRGRLRALEPGRAPRLLDQRLQRIRGEARRPCEPPDETCCTSVGTEVVMHLRPTARTQWGDQLQVFMDSVPVALRGSTGLYARP